MSTTTSEDALNAALAGFEPRRTNLLPALHLVQEVVGYLPGWAMDRVGRQLHVPASEVHGVASGYTEFRFEAPPPGLVQVCTGLSCRLAGAETIFSQARARRPEAVETIPCLFLCSLAPVVAVEERVFGHVDGQRLAELQKGGIPGGASHAR